MSKTATLIRRNLPSYQGTAHLYKLSPPIDWTDYQTDETKKLEYVIASGVNAMFSGPETLVFPSDENGKAFNHVDIWGERGYINPNRVLEEQGYTIIEQTPNAAD